jgi:transcriptional repressor NrdR
MCRSVDTRVVDSRSAEQGRSIRRRRECSTCGHRFTTYERAAYQPLVRKRDGRLEPFLPDKVRAGIEAAIADRHVPTDTVEAIVMRSESLFDPETQVVSAAQIGDTILSGLRAVDEVAYLRFASVYKEFTGAGDFEREMAALEESP